MCARIRYVFFVFLLPFVFFLFVLLDYFFFSLSELFLPLVYLYEKESWLTSLAFKCYQVNVNFVLFSLWSYKYQITTGIGSFFFRVVLMRCYIMCTLMYVLPRNEFLLVLSLSPSSSSAFFTPALFFSYAKKNRWCFFILLVCILNMPFICFFFCLFGMVVL